MFLNGNLLNITCWACTLQLSFSFSPAFSFESLNRVCRTREAHHLIHLQVDTKEKTYQLDHYEPQQ
jgi:hypothetical protein